MVSIAGDASCFQKRKSNSHYFHSITSNSIEFMDASEVIKHEHEKEIFLSTNQMQDHNSYQMQAITENILFCPSYTTCKKQTRIMAETKKITIYFPPIPFGHVIKILNKKISAFEYKSTYVLLQGGQINQTTYCEDLNVISMKEQCFGVMASRNRSRLHNLVKTSMSFICMKEQCYKYKR